MPVAARALTAAAPRGRGDAGRYEAQLRIPDLAFPVLPRPRLSRLLDAATRRQVTLVLAPSGAGKTVACAWWAAGRPATGWTAWLTVDPGDRRDWFWACLCRAVTLAQPGPAAVLRSLADSSAESFPLRLVTAARAFPRPLVVVLDGAHEVADPAVLTGLDVIIRHAPRALRLLLVARRPPSLNLHRARDAGELACVRAADLAWTAEEERHYRSLVRAATRSPLAPPSPDPWISPRESGAPPAAARWTWPGQSHRREEGCHV